MLLRGMQKKFQDVNSFKHMICFLEYTTLQIWDISRLSCITMCLCWKPCWRSTFSLKYDRKERRAVKRRISHIENHIKNIDKSFSLTSTLFSNNIHCTIISVQQPTLFLPYFSCTSSMLQCLKELYGKHEKIL